MRGALGLVCLLVLVAAPATPRAQACLPPTVTLLVDRSSSMRFDLDTDDDVRSKWSIQRDALLDLATNHQAKLALGLTVLPRFTGDCTPASHRIVSPAIFQKAVIATALARMVPETDAWSPIGQAFVELGEADDTGRVVIFITDGVQSCPPMQPGEQWSLAQVLAPIQALRERGTRVYIVGFGSSLPHSGGDDVVNVPALNAMAWAGGGAPEGCDSKGTAFDDPHRCFAGARNLAELAAALDTIARREEAAACAECEDGEERPCAGVETGECTAGIQRCDLGAWSACAGAVTPVPESCDGLDNDCDGVVDEVCECPPGATRACGGPDVGVCRGGVRTCGADGAWGACVGEIGPTFESCDGLDNDCDAVVDEGCDCRAGATRACGGPDVGVCHTGTQICGLGAWGPCYGAAGPQPEICDGLDNDCDGEVDHGCACATGESRVCGYPEAGQCREGVQTCAGGAWGACVGTLGPATELCDGLDNDCDGEVDEAGDVPCPSGFTCRGARCVPAEPVEPPPDDPDGGQGGCHVAGGGAAGSWLLAAALLFIRRRRTRGR